MGNKLSNSRHDPEVIYVLSLRVVVNNNCAVSLKELKLPEVRRTVIPVVKNALEWFRGQFHYGATKIIPLKNIPGKYTIEMSFNVSGLGNPRVREFGEELSDAIASIGISSGFPLNGNMKNGTLFFIDTKTDNPVHMKISAGNAFLTVFPKHGRETSKYLLENQPERSTTHLKIGAVERGKDDLWWRVVDSGNGFGKVWSR